MAWSNPREGNSLGFRSRIFLSDEWTLGEPEKIVWASIKHMTVTDVADYVLFETHKVKSKRSRSAIVRNLKLYIRQASEFYEAAQIAKANTAPLFYYYSFLNLAKSLCEIMHPKFHREAEC